MKRYIRLKSGKIIDTATYTKSIEQFKKLHPTESIDEYLDTDSIVAESDEARYLFMVGDLAKFTAEAENNEEEYIVELDTTAHVIQFLNNIQAGKIHLVKLYAKNCDDYILVWDKERDVI